MENNVWSMRRHEVDRMVAVQTAIDLALEWLEGEDELPRKAHEHPEVIREKLGIALDQEGCGFAEVVEALRAILAKTPSPSSLRFISQLYGGRDPVATLAEMLTPLLNTNLHTYKVAGPQVLIEHEILARMCAAVGFKRGEGIMCPGGSLANLTAMIIARNEAVEGALENGVGGQQLTVYTSSDGHYSVPKNAGFVGIGCSNVRDLPTDRVGCLDVPALERSIADDLGAGCRPILINATAGTTLLGAFDPLRAISEVAREHGIWLHVDAALGGTVLLSAKHRHLLDGSELADSFTWNAHKMMGVPVLCSVLLLRRQGLLQRHLGQSADYLFETSCSELDPGNRSIQCGRRNDALKLWAAWRYQGDRGWSARVDRQFELAQRFAAMVRADAELELSAEPQSVNICFEVRGRSSAAICDLLDQEGRLKISHGVVGGRRVIRMVCVNPELEETDLERIFDEIKAAGARLLEVQLD